MGKIKMAEPASSGIAGFAGWKLIGGAAGVAAGGAGLAAFVVMCMTKPRSDKEWIVGLVCTVIGSVCGGAAVISYFHLYEWVTNFIGLTAILGLSFSCGLPAWAIVRWIFNYIDTHQDASIEDVANDLRSSL